MHAARVSGEAVMDPAGSGPVAILAGSGELPRLLADRLAATGRPYRILAFRGFASRDLRADAVVGLLDVTRAVSVLDGWAPSCVTMAGAISRPRPVALLDAYAAFRDRQEIARVVAGGDDAVLRGVAGLLEERGHRLVGIRELAPELLAATGLYGRCRPGEADGATIAAGFRLLDALSPFDVGQAAVLRGRRVLAIEGPEGTDRMLARARRASRAAWFRRAREGGVLVKGPKRGQDLRVDLPAIGSRTVENAARAGLAGIAVASGLTLVLGREATVRAADRLGLFLVGLDVGARAGAPPPQLSASSWSRARNRETSSGRR